MKYLEQVKTKNNSFIGYLKGSLIFVFSHFLGQIPLSLYLIYQSPNFEDYLDHNELLSSLPSNTILFLILLPFVVTLPFLKIVINKIHKQSFTALFCSRNKVDFKRIIFSFLLWGGISILMILINYIVSPEDYEWNFKLIPFLVLFFIGIVLIPLQTSVEEFLFRGYLMQGFGMLNKK